MVEDVAQAFGSIYNERHLGTFGDAGCFSFAPNKIITTGQGGAIVTNNKKIYKSPNKTWNSRFINKLDDVKINLFIS